MPKKKREQVESALDTKLVATRSTSYNLYFVKWESQLNSYNNRITKDHLLKYSRATTPCDLELGGSEFLREGEDDAEHLINKIFPLNNSLFFLLCFFRILSY